MGSGKANISWGNRHVSFVDFDIFKKHDFFSILFLNWKTQTMKEK